jgi:hypothetical protein
MTERPHSRVPRATAILSSRTRSDWLSIPVYCCAAFSESCLAACTGMRPRLPSNVVPSVSSRGALDAARSLHPGNQVPCSLHEADLDWRPATINRQRRRLFLTSAAALAGSVGLSARTTSADAQQADPPPGPGAAPGLPSIKPFFAPKPVIGSGTFTPNTITLSVPGSAPINPPIQQVLPPGVRGREVWNAAPPTQPYTPQIPKGVSLHHTGAAWNGSPGPEQYLRNIQHFHTGPQREWEDIAYHYLVDLDGVIWAGRPPTVRGNPSIYYDPTGLVLISFLGDFSWQEPSEAQLNSAADAAAWLMKKYTIPLTALTGHRDHAPTTCPGDNIYRCLRDGSFAAKVRESLNRLR